MKKVNPNFDETVSKNFISDLKKEPLLNDFIVDEINANILFIKLKDYKNCKVCKGLIDCKNDTSGFYNDVVFENKMYKNVILECKYKKDKNEVASKSTLIKTLYMPKSILNARLDNYVVNTESRKKVFNYINKFVNEYSRTNFLEGLALIGQYGIGKTYLLAALANELSKKNVESLMIYFPDMARELKGALGTPRFEELINMLKDIDVLMIDDFGAEMMTPWLRDEVLGPIINYRSGERLPIFISSNLNLEQLQEHLSLTREGLDSTKGMRILDRLKRMLILVEIPDEAFNN